MKSDFKLSKIDIKRTLLTCLIIFILGILVLFTLVKFKIWVIIAPADKVFVALIFIILFSTIGLKHKKNVKIRK
ncbi:MAG: hypothetical protein ACP5N1_04890 [Candidatus Woesearchaeota archaeon]